MKSSNGAFHRLDSRRPIDSYDDLRRPYDDLRLPTTSCYTTNGRIFRDSVRYDFVLRDANTRPNSFHLSTIRQNVKTFADWSGQPDHTRIEHISDAHGTAYHAFIYHRCYTNTWGMCIIPMIFYSCLLKGKSGVSLTDEKF